MKRFALSFAALLVVASSSLAVPKTPKAKTFSGEIMDSQCAMNGSHAQMEKMKGMPDDSKMCTLKCVEMGQTKAGSRLFPSFPQHRELSSLQGYSQHG